MKQLRSVLPYVHRYRGGLTAGLLFVALSNVAPAATPWLTGIAIDAATQPGTATSYIIGIAALKSSQSGEAVRIADLTSLDPLEVRPKAL